MSCCSTSSDRNVRFGCCQHWPSLSSFSSTWRSDGSQNENDNVWITQFCSLRTTCLEWSATDIACILNFLYKLTWKLVTAVEEKMHSNTRIHPRIDNTAILHTTKSTVNLLGSFSAGKWGQFAKYGVIAQVHRRYVKLTKCYPLCAHTYDINESEWARERDGSDSVVNLLYQKFWYAAIIMSSVLMNRPTYL